MSKNTRGKLIREVPANDLNSNKKYQTYKLKNTPKDEIPPPYAQSNNVEIQRFSLSVASLRQVFRK